MDRFENLIKEFGTVIGEKLELDNNFVCAFSVDDTLDIQFEYVEPSEQIAIIGSLGEIPPGKYRETLLENAMLANGESTVYGILSYLKMKNALFLHQLLEISELNGEKLATYLSSFVEKALEWQYILQSGNLPPPTSSSDGSIFDPSKRN